MVETSAAQKLTFSGSLLTSRTNELVASLKELHGKLSKLDQELVDTTTLDVIRKDLVSRSILANKDKAVKAIAACCLADVLRLFAPDAPYTENELKDIFNFFIRQLKSIGEVNSPYFSYYYYLLESLSTIKTVVLLTDIGAEDLIHDLFSCFFNHISLETSKNVYLCMLDVLQQLVEECQTLPHEVLELILFQFKPKRQNASPAALKLASDLCNTTTDRLQRYVCQYFSQIIIDAGRNLDDESDLTDFENAHALILEMNKFAPSVLLSVIPQLDEEMKVDVLSIRYMATSVLGQMFSAPNSQLASTYEKIWTNWLDRRHDKHLSIRLHWLEYFHPLIKNYPNLGPEIEQGLRQKLLDPDDRVRVAAIQTLDKFELEGLGALSKSLLFDVAQRCRDKKLAPRLAAIHSLGRIYKITYGAREDVQEDSSDKYKWIPGALFEALYTEDSATVTAIEKEMDENVFYTITDDKKRTQRLIQIYASLNTRQRMAFKSLLDRQTQAIANLTIFLEQCDKFNGGIMDQDEEETQRVLHLVVQFISQKMLDPKKAQQHLVKFAEINDRSVYKLMHNMMDPSRDYKYILKHHKEIIKRLEKHTGLGDTMTILLRRACVKIVSKNSVPYLLDYISKLRGSVSVEDNHLGQAAEMLVGDISSALPAIYKSQTEKLVKLILEDNPITVTEALRALCKFVKAFPDEAPKTSDVTQRIEALATDGTVEQAKSAIQMLLVGGFDAEVERVFDKCVELKNLDETRLDVALCSLNQMVKRAYDKFEPHRKDVSKFAYARLITNHNLEPSDEPEWEESDNLEMEGKIKILCLKIIINGLTTTVTNDSNFSFAIKLIKKTIEEDGELSPTQSTPSSIKANLRLTAAKGLLKLYSNESLVPFISPLQISQLSLVIQDPVFRVRQIFVEKLCQFLQLQKIPFDFIALLPLIAHEPEHELKNMVMRFLSKMARQQRIETLNSTALVEHTFVRLLYILSHHPDLSASLNDLQMFSAYIDFFLHVVGTSNNVSYLYFMAGKLKMSRDAHSSDSTNLYMLSELAQFLIQDHCASHSWTLSSYQGNPKLPRDLFLSDKDAERTSEVYLPDEWYVSRGTKVPQHASKPQKPVLVERANSDVQQDAEEQTKKKAQMKKTGKAKTTASKKRRAVAQDVEEIEDEPEQEENTPPRRRNASRRTKKDDKRHKEVSDEDEEDDQENEMPSEADRMEVESV